LQLRDKLDVADELRKKIETLQREHENEILTIKNDHRDRMDRMKEWYMSELHKRDEMFALLLTRTATITTTSTV
jgi:low affinity Fe/Cu permease